MKSPRPACRLVVLLGIGVGVLAMPALAADCPELVGRLPYGAVSTVAVSGDYAYFNSGDALKVADVSDPSAPRVLGYAALPGPASDIAVSSGYAYVVTSRWDATWWGYLRVVDVSTPSAPVEVGSYDTPGGILGVAVAGSYAYVAHEDGSLRVIDVSKPSAPFAVGFVDTPGGAYGVAVAGDYAYAVGRYPRPGGAAGYLQVIDVSNPTAPVEVGFLITLQEAWGVAVDDGYAYVASGSWDSPEGGLSVIDVSTPSAPVEVGFFEMSGLAWDVAVSGDYAYMPWRELDFREGGLRVIDVSTPSAPVEVGFFDTLPSAEDVAVSGTNAYVAAGGAGLRVIDVSIPSAPVEVGSLDTWGDYLGEVAVSDGYAYVVGYGLHVIDVSTPALPFEVGFLDRPDETYDVAVSGRYAYVAWSHWYSSEGGLRVIDVSAPSAPVEVGFVDTSGYGDRDVALSDGYAYVSDFGEGLRVIDVSTPSAPVEVGFVEIPGHHTDVAVAGDYAYVVTGGLFQPHSLRVIDVSTPSAPVEVGFVDTIDAFAVAVDSGYAYVVGFGLSVIDVSTPSAPVEVGWLNSPSFGMDVEVSNGLAYVADGGRGLLVIDVRVPSAPVEVGHSGTPGTAADVSDGHVFLAARGGGLYVVRECDPLGDPNEFFIPAAAVAAGAQGAFFSTAVEVNNKGPEEAQVSFQWLPRGEDNSEPLQSEPTELASGQSLRYENVLTELFNLEPDSLGALKMVASTSSVIGMSRTYNSPEGKAAGTLGQGLPAIRATEMIQRTQPRRILFLSEDDDSRANVGCVNGTDQSLRINIALFNAEGEPLETKTMDLGPWSNDQINRVFQGYAPVNGYVDVWADSDEALFYCYGSALDNLTSDPTTILPQVPWSMVPWSITTFIPAAALAAGLEDSFFQTDVELNNVGSTDLTYELLWLPRGADNSDPVHSDPFLLAPGAGVRYANVLDEVFNLEADQVGALAVEASGSELLAMSRTYNLPSAKVAGTFGQELPGIPADRMIHTGVKKRIIFLSDNEDVRANVGCQNGVNAEVVVVIELYGSDGVKLETKYMMLPPYSNRQINGIFQDYAPVNGYVDVWTDTPYVSIYCYGSVLDNVTSDPTTVLPQ